MIDPRPTSRAEGSLRRRSAPAPHSFVPCGVSVSAGRASVVDQHVDARLGGGDLVADALHLAQDRQVGDMGAMGNVGTCLPECCEGGVRTPAVARLHYDARAQGSQPDGGDLSDAGRGAGDDDDLAVNGGLLGSDTRFRMRPSLTPKFGRLQVS